MAFKIRDIFISIGIEADEATINRIDKGLNQVKSSADLTAIAVKGIAIAFGAAAIATGFFLKQAGELEQTEVAFETMLGSADKAKKLLDELFTLAATTPFEINDVLKNSKLLLGMGIEADNVIETMTNLGNVAAGLSVPIGRLALNFGQVQAQGKLTGRELRDFAIAGVPLVSELAKNLGVSKDQIASMVSAGKIGFPEVEEAFRTMATGTGRFSNLMQKQSKTLLGLWSNLKDIVTIFAQEVGTELLPAAKDIANEMINWFNANRKLIKSRAIAFFKDLSKFMIIVFKVTKSLVIGIFGLIKAFGGLEKIVKSVTTAFLVLAGLQMLSAIGNIAIGIWNITKAMKALRIATLLVNAALAVWPIIIGAIILFLAIAIEDIIGFFQGKKSITGRIVEEFKNMQSQLGDIIGGTIDEIFNNFRDAWSDFQNLPLVKFLTGAGSKIGGLAADVTGFFGGSPSSSPAAGGGGGTSTTSVSVSSPITVTVPDGTPPELVGSSIQNGILGAFGDILRTTQRDVEPLVDF